jgi:hypothetical protein
LFLFVCYKAVGLLKKEIGGWASVLFVIGFLSISTSKKNVKDDMIIHHFPENKIIQPTNFIEITLQERLSSKLSLITTCFVPQKDSVQYQLVTSNLSITGFYLLGFDYQLNDVLISPVNNTSTSKYQVSVSEKWMLGGIELYANPLRYEGTTILK